MSPLSSRAALENKLENEGTLTLSDGDIAGLFDYRARRLVMVW